MNYGIEMTQINDALTQTAACAGEIAYDKANGLVFVSYMTGLRKRYGESTGKVCLSVFSPSQPHNVRHRVIDVGVGQSRGLLCNANYMVGDGINRMIFTTTRGELGVFYRDYDFYNDTVSERVRVLLRTEKGDVFLDKNSYKAYLGERGLKVEDSDPIINKVTSYKGELYTAVSNDATGYPILCKIEDNVLVPFAVCPEPMTYEFRYFINDDDFLKFPPPIDNRGRIWYN